MYYGTLSDLVESLAEAKTAGNLARRLKVLTHPALLVVDEIGYVPVNRDGAVLFFQLINARHERASTGLIRVGCSQNTTPLLCDPSRALGTRTPSDPRNAQASAISCAAGRWGR